jgi:plasmid stabilization system protein ParE
VKIHDNDVDEIAGYLESDLKNPQAASEFLDDVEKSYRTLTTNPHLFALCTDERLYREGYRKSVIKNYLVLYRIDEAKKTVYVVRIVYGARDYPQLL